MPSEQENLKLMYAILQQQMTSGQLVAIDWQKVATDLGIETAGAASKRWSRLKTEILKDAPPPTSGEETPKKTRGRKAPNPKEKMEKNATEKPKRAPKKRKAEVLEEEVKEEEHDGDLDEFHDADNQFIDEEEMF